MVGIIYLEPDEIFGNSFVLYGILSAAISFRKQKKGVLFFGSVSFLLGLTLYLVSSFDLVNTNAIVFPALMFIFSASFFMLFLDDFKGKIFLLLSVVFFVSGLISTILIGTFSTATFFNAFGEIITRYWIIELLILLALIWYNFQRDNN